MADRNVESDRMTAPVCLITGVGPGTGSALARRFAEGGYRVAMLARNEERLAALEKQLPAAKAYRCDVSDLAQIEAAASAVERDLGSPSVVIHNAVGGAFGTFREIDPDILNRNFQVNTMGLLHLARRFAPAMTSAGKGAIVATGNTSSLRGKAGFAGFAPTKAAQRILAEAMARDLGPQGVHVAYVVIDAVIDLEWTRKRWPERPDDFFIKPVAIANEIWHVVHQDRSAWSFNVEIRPFGEAW
jgi:NAD(P)-dependent dehydrogenase (short-subunit alcohol dehydrogenase family)